jgi:hypothetical protein
MRSDRRSCIGGAKRGGGCAARLRRVETMKSIVPTCVAGVVLLVVAASGAVDVSLTDYVFPKSATQEAYVNGVFNALGNSLDSTEVGYNLAGSASYDLNLRSLPFSYDFSALADFSVAKSTVEDADTEDSYDFFMSTTADKYLRNDSKLFGYGAAALHYRKLSGADEADDPRIDIEGGVGYGRTINATVLKQAIRMNEDFKKYDVITGDMPRQALLDLAAVIDRGGEFRSQYGPVEYRKYWYEAMEEVVRNSGVLSGDALGAIGIIRIQEVLDESTAQRWHGWVARGGVGVRVSDYDGEAGDPYLTARFDWTRPVSLRLQLTNNASLSTVFEDDQTYNLQDVFRVDYEVSNRIDWYNSLTLNYDILTADGAENILGLNLQSTYILYIENELTFNPGVQYSYLDTGIGDATWDWGIQASISYRLR